VNLTDIHYELLNTAQKNEINQVRCPTCSQPVLGALFECINCEDTQSPRTLCVKCLQRDMSSDRHKDHAFIITNPLRLGPAVALIRTTVGSDGLIKIHGVKEACTAARKNRGRVKTGPTQQQERRTGFGWGMNPNPIPQGISPKRQTRAVMCRVDVYPDGRIVFADNPARAVEWISLDGIAFQACGHCKKKPYEVVTLKSEVCNPETENRVLCLLESSLSGMHFHNGNLRLLSPVDDLPPHEAITLGTISNLAQKKAVCTDTGVAVALLDDNSLSLNQLSVDHCGTQKLEPLSSPLVADGVEVNIKYCFDRDDAITKLHGDLTFSKPLTHSFGDGSSDMLLFTLPDILRPTHTHDVLVFGQGSSHRASSELDADPNADKLDAHANSTTISSSGSGSSSEDNVDASIGVGAAVLRFYSDGQVLLRCLTIDTPCALQKLFLSSIIYKTVPSHVSGKSSLEISSFSGPLTTGQFVFGDNVCSSPDPNTHHARRPFSLAQDIDDDFRILEEAAQGGYTSCTCRDYPCPCIVAARERFRPQGGVLVGSGDHFGIAGIHSKDGHCFLTGQVMIALCDTMTHCII
jgi:hypothetical protein